MKAILAAALADLRQRLRSYRFLVVLMLTLLACAYMMPAPDAGYAVMQLGAARGLYGAAWTGFVFGAIAGSVLPLLGFYLVKDAVQRDRDTRVGVLLASSRLSRWGYVSAKFLSNAATLGAVVATAIAIAPVMQWWRGEDPALDPLVTAAHVLLLATPSLLAVAALAVLFECLPLLRGAVGNVAFFFLWGLALSGGIAQPDQLGKDARGPMVQRRADLFGMTAPMADFEARLAREVPAYPRTLAVGVNIGRHIDHRIAWPGMLGDRAWIGQRLAWSLLFLPFLLAAAVAFDRFDPARNRRRGTAGAAQEGNLAPPSGVTAAAPWRSLTPIAPRGNRWRPLAMLGAELRLLLWRLPWWWYAVAAGAWVAGATTPIAEAVRLVVPLAWFWALARWSQHGARAEMHDVARLLASAPAPIRRQLPLQWLAGVAMGLVLALPVLLRLVAGGSAATALQALAGAGLVSALALACGALSRGPRLFELLFLILTYASLQRVPGTAVSGEHGVDLGNSSAFAHAAWAAGLLLVAAAARWRAMRR